MKIKNVSLTVLKFSHRHGLGKSTGKSYDFFQASVVDEDANVFGFTLSDSALKQAQDEKLLDQRNFQVLADLSFSPKGFDVAGQIQSIEVQ